MERTMTEPAKKKLKTESSESAVSWLTYRYMAQTTEVPYPTYFPSPLSKYFVSQKVILIWSKFSYSDVISGYSKSNLK